VQAEKGSAQSVTLTLTALPVGTTAAKPVTSAPVGGGAMRTAEAPTEEDGVQPNVGWIVGAGAVAAVGIGLGIGFTVAANHKAAEAEALDQQIGGPSACAGGTAMAAGPCAELPDVLSDKDTFSNGAVVSFAIGGALAVGTAALAAWALWGSKEDAGVRAVPVVGMRHGGVTVVGAW
jgi:hypothetical protein